MGWKHARTWSAALCGIALIGGALAACGSSSSGGSSSGTTTPPAAGPYTMTVNGSGYSPHIGQLFKMALVDSTGTVVDRKTIAAPPGLATTGNYTFTFSAELAQGATYTVDSFADFNNNGVCDAPPVDHVWHITSASTDPNWTGQAGLASVQGDVTLTLSHDTNFAGATCTNL